MAKFNRVVESASEYNELVRAAETLDLKIRDVYFSGSWQTMDGEPCWPSASEVIEVSMTHFKVMMDGEEAAIRPEEGASVSVELRA